MEIHKFPNDDKKSPSDEEKKMPEFIDLEKEEQQGETFSFQEQQGFPPPAEMHLPWWYRILFLIGGILVAMWTIGGLVIQGIFCTAYTLTLFQSKIMQMLVYDCWGRVCKGTVVSLSLFVAVFSPQFALVVILSYFMTQGPQAQQGTVGRVLQKYFGDLMH